MHICLKNFITLFFFSLLSVFAFAQDQFEPNNDFNTATNIVCGNFYDGYIQVEGDQDWYIFEIIEPSYVNFDLINQTGNVDLNLAIYQETSGLTKLIIDDGEFNSSGTQDLSATTYLPSGTYYVLVNDENNNDANTTQFYRLEITCISSIYEINQTFQTASHIEENGCIEERIFGKNMNFETSSDNGFDKDWYSVVISETGYLTVDVTSVPGNVDLDVKIYAITNNLLELVTEFPVFNSSAGQDIFANAFVRPDTYYIYVEDENNNDQSEDTYTLCTSFISSSFEINQTLETAIPISTEGCFEERIYGEDFRLETSNANQKDKIGLK